MTNALTLDLNSQREITLDKQSGNIISNISDAFSNAVKKGTEAINFPDNIGEKVKAGLEKIDIKEIGSKAVESALRTGMKNLGMKTSTFDNIKGVFEAIKEGDLKGGLNSGINAIVSVLKIPTTAKTLIKDAKSFILDKAFEDELKTVMKKQQNTISRIDKKCTQMEEAFKNNDTKTLDRVAKTLKTDLEKVMPIQNVITKGNATLNKYELYKNKGTNLNSEELELCEKLA